MTSATAAVTGTRRAPSVRLIVEFAAIRGIAVDVCLRGSGIDTEELATPDLHVTPDQELVVVANVVSAIGDEPGLGIAAGIRYHVTTHGIWGYALMSSPTLRHAIDLGLRYLELTFSYCDIVAHEEDGLLTLVVDPMPAPQALRRFIAERDIGIIDALQRELVGTPRPLRAVQLPYAEPSPQIRTELRRLLGVAPEFDADRYAVCFDLSRVNDPLPLAEPLTAAMAEEQCRELLERSVPTGLSGQVRSLLLGNPARPLTSEQVSAALFMTPRTLRRRLLEEGATYRSLLENVRRQVAEELLGETALSVAEIAQRLGYSETASFTHAFRRWTGSSPRSHRVRGGSRNGGAHR
ncbi:AraC family transcriptional regulator [Antrihabitans sp. YC3-6]|uniref:AraC family transcriptional regulator n=1 Tax=Antrihabitans stalagmiti TaxID=2799499 RepID=A0A934NSJ4_9NOCA|nr:AraC family transcriptional regulator [Antrihabitans stalagmiti]MBJ8340708.1 AraC family transcriptional regulator [Antrihabitans stalagmiti]